MSYASRNKTKGRSKGYASMTMSYSTKKKKKKKKIPSPPRYVRPTSKSLRRNLRFTSGKRSTKSNNENYMRRLRDREDQENCNGVSSKKTTSFTKERAQLQTVISKLRKENRELEERVREMETSFRQLDRESKSKASLERVEAIESDLTKTRNKLKTCMRRSREDRDAWQLALETMKTENRSLVIKLEVSRADLKRKEGLITKLKAREDDKAKTELIATLQEKLARLEAQAREFQPSPTTVSPIRSVAEEEEEENSVNVSTYTPRRDYTSGVYDLLKAFEDEDRECDGTIHVKRFVHILQSRAGTVPAFKVMARPEELSHLLEMFGPDRGMEHERIDYPAFVDFVMGSYKSPTSSRSPSSSPTRTPLDKKKKKKSEERSYISSAAETVRRQRRRTTTTPSSAPATTRRREQMKITSALWRRRRAKFDEALRRSTTKTTKTKKAYY